MTTKLLNEDITTQVQEVLGQLQEPVEVLFFGTKQDCEYCAETLQLVEEVVDLSDKLGLTVYDIEENDALAKQYKVDKTPGLVIAGVEGGQVLDYGVRFAGIPSGHEFSSLVQDLILVSGRDSGIESPDARVLGGTGKASALAGIRHPDLRVLPACGCAGAPDGDGKPDGGGRNGGSDGISGALATLWCERSAADHHQRRRRNCSGRST